MTASPPRKYPFPTLIYFTIASLHAEAARLQALGLPQVEYSSKKDPGLKADIYGYSGKITLGSRYCLNRRPKKSRLGELGLISLEQARQKHRSNRQLAAQGIDPDAPAVAGMTLNMLHHDHFLVQCRARQKKSLKTDISRYEHWIGPEFGDTLLPDITTTRVNAFVLKMQNAGLAPSSVKKTISQLGSYLTLSVNLDLLTKNVVKAVRLPPVHNRRDEFLTVTQLSSLYRVAMASDNVVGSRRIALMMLTGARCGEIRAAKWADISLSEDVWRLPTQKSGRPGEIYLSEAAKAVIRQLAAVRRNEYLCPGMKSNDQLSPPVKLYKRLCALAGIPKSFRLHDLRHGWVSTSVEAGVPMEIISQGARHSSPSVTRLYSHVHKTSLLAAQEKVAEMITFCDAHA
jgi:integrase